MVCSKILNFGRILIQVVLLAIFFHFFGLPAIKRFQAKEVILYVLLSYLQFYFQVMVVESRKDTEGIPAPTISLFPYSKNNSVFRLSLEQIEELYNSDLQSDEYMTQNTYNQSDILIDIFLGYTRKMSLMGGANIVTEEMMRPLFGRYYVLRPSFKIGTDFKSDQIYLVLFRHLNYVIHVYDPHFYLGFFNPSIPVMKEIVKPDVTVGKYYTLILTEVRNGRGKR